MDFRKLSRYLFFTFLFLLPFQTVFLLREPSIGGDKWQYGTIGAYAIDILLVTILGLVLVRWLQSIKYKVSGIQYGTTGMALMFFAVWSGLSIFWAGDQVLAGYFFVKILLGAGLFFVVRSLDVSLFQKIIFVLLMAGVVQSSIGIGQFMYQYSPGNTWLGMSAHEASQPGSSVLKLDSGRFLRAYGTFPHPNMLGGFLGVVLVLSLGYSIFTRARATQPSLLPYSISSIAYLSSLIIILLLGLILTFSRTAWLGTSLGILSLTLYSFFSSRTRKLRSWFSGIPFKVLGMLAVAGIVFVGILHEQIFPRFDTATIKREGSVTERMASLQNAKELIVTHPFFGVGAGNFTAEIIRKNPDRPVWSIQPVHNVFVLVWAELGLVGLFLFLAFLSTLVFTIQSHIIFRSEDYVQFFRGGKGTITIIALLTLLPSLFLDHWLWTSHFGLFFLFLLFGLVVRERKSDKE